ncbi:MAG: NfeD family protein [Thermoanaerobaculaceae bacterium]
MTWTFAYFALLFSGLVLALGFGVLESLTKQKHLAMPRAELVHHRRQIHICHLGMGLTTFGVAGFLLSIFSSGSWQTVLLVGLFAGLLGWLAGRLCLRLPCPHSVSGMRATVVTDIPPGGYGQVRITNGNSETVLAAQNNDPDPIPAGSLVEIVDCHRSVVGVRRLPAP